MCGDSWLTSRPRPDDARESDNGLCMTFRDVQAGQARLIRRPAPPAPSTAQAFQPMHNGQGRAPEGTRFARVGGDA